MRVDGTDVQKLRGYLPVLIEEAATHIDSLYNYLLPGEEPRPRFEDPAELTAMARLNYRLQQILVACGQFSLWAEAIELAIEQHGPDATVDHVASIVTPLLATRATHLTTDGGSTFELMMCQSLGEIIDTCRQLKKADADIDGLIQRTAPSLGLTPDGMRAELKAGMPYARRALAEEAYADTEKHYLEMGQQVPSGARSMMMAAAGVDEAEHLDADTANIFERMGINASDVHSDGMGNFEVQLTPAALARMMDNGGARPIEIG